MKPAEGLEFVSLHKLRGEHEVPGGVERMHVAVEHLLEFGARCYGFAFKQNAYPFIFLFPK